MYGRGMGRGAARRQAARAGPRLRPTTSSLSLRDGARGRPELGQQDLVARFVLTARPPSPESLPHDLVSSGSDGRVLYTRAGQPHRLDGPAVVGPGSRRAWFFLGFPGRLGDGPSLVTEDGHLRWEGPAGLDRDDGPAVVHADGTQEFWQSGQRHRLGGPAVLRADGGREFWEHGRLHRLDGPAVTRASGEVQFYVEGVLHRLDGPAWTTADGERLFYRDGMPQEDRALTSA